MVILHRVSKLRLSLPKVGYKKRLAIKSGIGLVLGDEDQVLADTGVKFSGCSVESTFHTEADLAQRHSAHCVDFLIPWFPLQLHLNMVQPSVGNHLQFSWSINRPIIGYIISGINFRSFSKNKSVPTFRIYEKHSLSVNMAVDIINPKFITNLS